LILATLLTTAAQVSVFESGASGSAWSPRASQAWDSPLASATLVIDRASPRQEILGFGACFTDTSAYNAMVFMQQDVRDAFVEAMWGGSGLRSSVMRMHINSPDYAVHSYNLDNTTDDFELIHFDAALTYDSQRVLPLARLALAKAASWGGTPLKLFGSPWSPPGWMKVNNDMINSGPVCLKNDTAEGSYMQTWANYIAQWVLAVEAHLNTSLWAVTPQNEPEARQAHFESCAYDVPHYVEWVGKYLGPVLAKAAPHVKILAYDHNKLDSLKFVEGLAGDPRGLVAWHGTVRLQRAKPRQTRKLCKPHPNQKNAGSTLVRLLFRVRPGTVRGHPRSQPQPSAAKHRGVLLRKLDNELGCRLFLRG